MSSSSTPSCITSSTLTLFSDWSFCNGCGLPPRIGTAKNDDETTTTDDLINDDNSCMNKQQQQTTTTSTRKKLLICRKCKTAAYHDSACQKIHWAKGRHKYECKKLSVALQPLRDISSSLPSSNSSYSNRRRCLWWWKHLGQKDLIDCNKIWKFSSIRWNRDEEYLDAMDGFQKALEPIMKIWNENNQEIILSAKESSSSSSSSSTTSIFGIQLARKLLFCAYCEADGNQPDSSRSRLAQCISILLQLRNFECGSFDDNKQQKKNHDIITPLLNDAWMELMFSYEDLPELRKITYHVAHMAIQSGKGRCEWNDPMQRPGYMAKFDAVGISDSNNNDCSADNIMSLPYILPEQHPEWCRILENNWKDIKAELSVLLLQNNNNNINRNTMMTSSSSSSTWGRVGCGNRGSGSDDHRVVSSGDWTEYVLFGTGAVSYTDDDAPVTKRLLKRYVADAVSLAESGGGEIIFSKLAPHTHIDAHCGPTNFRLTAHLGLTVPNNNNDDDANGGGECKIRVKNSWYYWETGKILLFDDSYEHEIRNDTDEVRIVLLMRFWHPLLRNEKRQLELSEARRQKEMAVEKRYHPPLV
ncbi:Asp_Arg_Hydrox-domain-containing protein [Fragilariopsis cylindrus CCMP1102]|uniref:Asp_Arg_Hydrox-domain-containing protein n=1 Tax=Fragilariopsis cylindrus CCMP1102 TaxID=635003 RepID=A0A1E7FWE3_9STRA|nr:Asp_Arg_Hydrox-domain-containing protein [Fragilariopsis cylindrus CCMP1102]|eukprot:OEU22123.1 Asp_Arg_Hydrox-domain-containing protein [Fragilariopsis cylindrus CCMP1102]